MILFRYKNLNGDEKMSGKSSIKTTAFGGFDKKQVDEYLDRLRSEYEKAANFDEYQELYTELERLKAELRKKDTHLKSLQEQADKSAAEQLQADEASQFDALTDSTEKFAQAHGEVVKIAEETGSYIKTTGKRLPRLLEKLTSLSEKIEEINAELTEISAELDEICPTATTDEAAEADKNESFFDIFAEHEDELNKKINALNPQK